jgi:DNA-binding transcriptional LysR family regulator
MTFDQIETFYLIATLGTYRKAAEKLNATQSTLSARITQLETLLGVTLFDRSGHRVALTPAGRQFLVYAERILQLRAEALRAIGGSEVRGIFRIGAADTMAVTVLPGFLSKLREAHPDATFELTVQPSHALLDELLGRHIDLAFMVGPVSNADIVSLPFCRCPMSLVAAPELGLAGQVPADALAAHEIFTFDRQTRPYHRLRQHLNETGRGQLRLSPVNSLQTVVLLTDKGLGLGAVPSAVVAEQLAAGSLTQVQSDIDLPEIEFCVAYPVGPETTAPAAVGALALEHLGALPANNSIKFIDQD